MRLSAATVFRASQITEEIVPFLDLVESTQPRKVVEIGTCRGGTCYLLARASRSDATVVTVDIDQINPSLVASFARSRQRVEVLEGDSSGPEIRAAIDDLLDGDPIDVLLIDGDHRYEGVKRDFETYAHLVRPGGLIAFHDIVPDNSQRTGISTGGWSGGVPQFWSEISARYAETHEFVADPDQDGLGIGVIRV